jgi:hypothetical protein
VGPGRVRGAGGRGGRDDGAEGGGGLGEQYEDRDLTSDKKFSTLRGYLATFFNRKLIHCGKRLLSNHAQAPRYYL